MTTSRDNRPNGKLFLLKQICLFAGMTLLILVVDALLYVAIACFEANVSLNNGDDPNSPKSEQRIPVSEIADSLSRDDTGTWIFSDPEAEQELLAKDAWAILIDESGSVEWSFNAPEDLPSSFTRNEIAVISHDRTYGNYLTFIWTKDSDLVMMGYPDSQFLFFGITLSSQAFLRIPLYFLLIFTIDLLIIFLLYAFSQRSILKNTGPLLDALDSLAQGRSTHVRFSGMLRVVGDRINAVSDTLVRKETARKRWVSGISHDARTPLSIAMGHAERMENDSALPKTTRNCAAIIVRQGKRIRDLIEDLNIATQLEYDMQPLKVGAITMVKPLREVVASYLNQGIDEHLEITLDVPENASFLIIEGDERLLKRALRNAIDNSLKHNPQRCRIAISLEANERQVILRIADDGRGMSNEQLFALAHMLEDEYLDVGTMVHRNENKVTFTSASSFIGEQRKPNGPTPPAESTSHYYGTKAPLISSQKKAMGKRIPSPNTRPPEPPLSANDPEGAFESSSSIESVHAYQNRTCSSGFSDRKTQNARPIPPRTAPHVTSALGNSSFFSHGGSIGKHGLGLPLIVRIVLVHKGEITLSSTEGAGFSITMAFPLKSEILSNPS